MKRKRIQSTPEEITKSKISWLMREWLSVSEYINEVLKKVNRLDYDYVDSKLRQYHRKKDESLITRSEKERDDLEGKIKELKGWEEFEI